MDVEEKISKDEVIKTYSSGRKESYISFKAAAKITTSSEGAIWKWTRIEAKYKNKKPLSTILFGKKTFVKRKEIEAIGKIRKIKHLEDELDTFKKFFYIWHEDPDNPFYFDELPSGQFYVSDAGYKILKEQVNIRNERRRIGAENKKTKKQKKVQSQERKEENLEDTVESLERRFDSLQDNIAQTNAEAVECKEQVKNE